MERQGKGEDGKKKSEEIVSGATKRGVTLCVNEA